MSTLYIVEKTFLSPGLVQANFLKEKPAKVKTQISFQGWVLKNGLAKTALSFYAKNASWLMSRRLME